MIRPPSSPLEEALAAVHRRGLVALVQVNEMLTFRRFSPSAAADVAAELHAAADDLARIKR